MGRPGKVIVCIFLTDLYVEVHNFAIQITQKIEVLEHCNLRSEIR
jgi:hypothetical protein